MYNENYSDWFITVRLSMGVGVCVSQHAFQVSRPTPKGELEGSGQGGLQAHTLWGGSKGPHLEGSPGPHLGVSRPTPRGVSRPTRGVYPRMHWGRAPLADGYCCGPYASSWNAFLLYWRFHWNENWQATNTVKIDSRFNTGCVYNLCLIYNGRKVIDSLY